MRWNPIKNERIEFVEPRIRLDKTLKSLNEKENGISSIEKLMKMDRLGQNEPVK